MKWDIIAMNMIDAFLENDILTSTKLTNIIFKPENRNDEINKNNLIISRLKTWVKKGIIFNGDATGKKAQYSINEDNVKIGQIVIYTEDGKQYDLGKHVTVDIKNEPILIFPLC